MTTYSSSYPGYRKQFLYEKSERNYSYNNGGGRYKSGGRHHNTNLESYNRQVPNIRLNGVDLNNGDSVSGTLLRVNTVPFEDDTSSYGSNITSNSRLSLPVYHVVPKSSMYGSRVEASSTKQQLKVDIYSVSVVMESKITGSFDPDQFKVEAVSPTGRVIKISGDSQYTAQFNSDEIGRWMVGMYYNGKYLDGCPVDVSDPSQVKVHDLKGGLVGKSNTFYVDCTNAGPGEVRADITCNSRTVNAHITPTNTPGYNKVTFFPYQAGKYEVNVHFNKAEVREGDVELLNLGERHRKAVFVTQVEPHHGFVEIRSMCNWEVDYLTGPPLICYVADTLDVSLYNSEDRAMSYQEMIGSPFTQEIVELTKPAAYGDGLYQGFLGKPTSFKIDPRGFPGQVSVAVNGPTRSVTVQLDPQSNQTIRATYWPTESGQHTVNVRMDGRDIEGSPFKSLVVDPVSVRVSGGWGPSLDENGIIPLKINRETHLPFDVSDAGPGELTSEVQGPSGKIPVTIDAKSDEKHSVIFTPQEEGKHYIYVTWSGFPLSNSPFLGYASLGPELEEHFNLRYPGATGSKAGTSGPQNNHPELYIPAEKVYRPTETVHIPHKPISRQQNFNDTPREQGHRSEPETVQTLPVVSPHDSTSKKHRISESAQTHPSSRPDKQYLEVPVVRTRGPLSSGASQKITLRGRGLKEARVNQPAHFTVDGSLANPGEPRSYLQCASDNIPVTSKLSKPNVYKCTYVPKKPGAYLLYISWDQQPLKGSPFQVNVQLQDAVKPDIGSSGQPQHGTVGQELSVKIDPSHTGSPYTVDIRRDLPKGPVRVWGPGVESGVLPFFQSTFWVDTTGSSDGDVRVRVMGPKGAFHVKIHRTSQTDKIYQCFYDPVEAGVYTIIVRWSGVDVPGSPFTVCLANSSRELQTMLEDMTDGTIVNGDDHSILTQRLSQNLKDISVDDVILY